MEFTEKSHDGVSLVKRIAGIHRETRRSPYVGKATWYVMEVP